MDAALNVEAGMEHRWIRALAAAGIKMPWRNSEAYRDAYYWLNYESGRRDWVIPRVVPSRMHSMSIAMQLSILKVRQRTWFVHSEIQRQIPAPSHF
jgi:hypothetical protein